MPLQDAAHSCMFYNIAHLADDHEVWVAVVVRVAVNVVHYLPFVTLEPAILTGIIVALKDFQADLLPVFLGCSIWS